MPKTPLTFNSPILDLKFFLAGTSGSGKTHLLGTYTAGPVHFYMFDRGGEKSLRKVMAIRPTTAPPITIDLFSAKDIKYSNFWNTFQKDESSGFFQELADQKGIAVFDSITTANIMARNEIAALSGLDLIQMSKKNDQKKAMHKALWGQLLGWMQQLVKEIQCLPCATVTTVHLINNTDKDGGVIARLPAVNGQFQHLITIDFDEVYLMENVGSSYNIHFKEHGLFKAKSRVFSGKKLTNTTMDIITAAYLAGDTLEESKGGKKPTLIKKKISQP